MGFKIGPEHLRDFERRRSQRFVLPREEDVTLVVGGRSYAGKLEDVSIGGAKLRLDEDVAPSDDLRLQHAAAGSIEATAKWQRGAVIGISFTLSDSAVDLIALCLRQGVPGSAFAA
jgi:hypothetical protein